MKKTIVKTDNYLLVVDDSEIKKGDLILTPYRKVVKALDVHTTEFTGVGTALNDCMKITAHLPLNDSPILEGVMLLPIPTFKVMDDYVYENGFDVLSHHRGFMKAKEKYKFTEEDVIRIVEKSRETGLTAEFLLFSLSQSKVPTRFEFDMERTQDYDFRNLDVPYYVIKTTTNSQGQEVACGQYIYAS